MSSLERAARCRRLAREVIGDPMEAALLMLAKEYEAGRAQATLSPTERRHLRGIAENWLQRAERSQHPALREVYRVVADSYSKLAGG